MQQALRSLALLFATLVFAFSGCGDNSTGGGGGNDDSPFADIPATSQVTVPGLDGQIDIVRDVHGIPHVYATTLADAGFGMGYAIATDRLPQMDLFRHVAEGRIGELFGALDRTQLDGDLEMRMHRMKPISEAAIAEMEASTDPIDQEIVLFAKRYADGVNHYFDELKAGQHTLDPGIAVWFSVDTFEPWTPVDSLAIGRLQAWALSYMADEEIRLSRDLQRATDTFVGAPTSELGRREMAFHDLLSVRPMQQTPTIDGYPNYPSDTGTRAKPAPGGYSSSPRPRVSMQLLDNAVAVMGHKIYGGLDLRSAHNGSNNWIVGPPVTPAGVTMVANDTHLPLNNPPIFYAMHITVPNEVDVEGVTFPGIPVILLGHNAHIGWGATVVFHDITDVYQETVVPCSSGGGDCVLFNTTEVPIETRTETIKVGARGTITEQHDYTYEMVPHHGPIVPIVENHEVVPRTAGEALSVRFSGYDVTQDVRAFYKLNRATTVEEAFAAMEDFTHGGQNWVIVDDTGKIGWTTIEHVPWRSAGCYTFSPSTPDGVAPYMIVPGDGSCEWEGWMDSRYIPHAIDPPTGFIATANADPIGETFDGDALNGPMTEDSHKLYLGALYDPGFRIHRIATELDSIIDGMGTPDDMKRIQANTASNYAEKMRPYLIAALDELAEEVGAPGTYPDIADFAAALTASQLGRLTDARARLAAWTLETPAGLGSIAGEELIDTTATTIFNAWVVFYQERVLGDELAAMGETTNYNMTTRALLALWERPGELHTGIDTQTGEPVLCDDLNTGETESCTFHALAAMDEALAWATNEGFGSPNMDDWRWGYKHTLTLSSLFPDEELNVPPPDDPAIPDGYPRPGDTFSVDSSDGGYEDMDFTYGHGPAIRHVTRFSGPGQVETWFALPGGEVFNRASPHYRDLMDQYWSVNEYFEFPFYTQQVIEAAEARTRIRAQ
jgi:penicillin G amidase